MDIPKKDLQTSAVELQKHTQNQINQKVLDFFSSWSGQTMTDAVASFSFLTNYFDITRGLIDLRSLLFFLTLIFFFLYCNTLIISKMRD